MIKQLTRVILFILLSIVSVLFLLLFTTPGLNVTKWVTNKVLSPYGVHFQGHISGRIDALNIPEFTIDNQTIHLQIKNLHLDSHLIPLLWGHLSVKQLASDQLNLTVKPPQQSSSQQQKTDNNRSKFVMPMPLQANSILINDINVNVNQKNVFSGQDIEIHQLSLINDQLKWQHGFLKAYDTMDIALRSSELILNPPIDSHINFNLNYHSGSTKINGNDLSVTGDLMNDFNLFGEMAIFSPSYQTKLNFNTIFQHQQIILKATSTHQRNIYLKLVYPNAKQPYFGWAINLKSPIKTKLSPRKNQLLISNITGQFKTDDQGFHLSTHQCHNTWDGQPINCQFNFNVHNQQWNIKKASLTNVLDQDHVNVQAKGAQAKIQQVNWHTNIHQVNHYFSKLSGKIQSQGDILVQSNGNIHLQSQLLLKNIAWLDQPIVSELTFVANKNKNQTENVSLNSQIHNQKIHLTGLIKTLRTNQIDLTINHLALLFGQIEMQLNSISQLQWQPDHLKLSPLQIADQFGSTAYIDFNWTPKSHNATLKGYLNNLSLNHFIPIQNASGGIDFKGHYQQKNSQPAQGNLTLKSEPGKVQLPSVMYGNHFSQGGQIHLKDFTGDLTLQNHLLQGSFNVKTQKDTIQGQIKSQHFDLSDLSNASLDGYLITNLPDLTQLNKFLPQTLLHVNQGQLNSEIHFSNELLNPQWHGRIDLTDTQADLIPYGIQIDDLNANAYLAPPLKLTLTSQGKIQKQPFKISGHLNGQDGLKCDLDIQGDKLPILNTEDIQLTMSPNLNLTIDDMINLQGKIHIDQAQINAEKIKNTAEQNTIADDVTYTNIPPNIDMPYHAEKKANYPLKLNIDMTLGNDLKVSGFGLNTYLKGSLQVISNVNAPIIGKGILYLSDGVFEIYGKRFTLSSDSQVVFNNNNLKNPTLKIEANYTIPTSLRMSQSNVPDEIGIEITGSAQNPSMRLFSNPTMPQADILSFIIFGQTLSQTQQSQQLQSNEAITQTALNFALRQSINQTLLRPLQQYLDTDVSVGTLDATSGPGDQNITTSGPNNTAVFVSTGVTNRIRLGYGMGLFNGLQEGIVSLFITPKLELSGSLKSNDIKSVRLLYRTHSKD